MAENPDCPHCINSTELKAYIRLKPMSSKQIDIGDIVKLSKEGEEVIFLGKVSAEFDNCILLNNSEQVFDLAEWDYDILHSDFEKE